MLQRWTYVVVVLWWWCLVIDMGFLDWLGMNEKKKSTKYTWWNVKFGILELWMWHWRRHISCTYFVHTWLICLMLNSNGDLVNSWLWCAKLFILDSAVRFAFRWVKNNSFLVSNLALVFVWFRVLIVILFLVGTKNSLFNGEKKIITTTLIWGFFIISWIIAENPF